MSYGEELMADMFSLDAEHDAAIASGTWTTKDDRTINIKEMSRKHLRNTIAMLERGNSPFADGWIARMRAELNFREYIEKIMRGEL